jgi:predicted enzyme related to lactoylglutathione lyase
MHNNCAAEHLSSRRTTDNTALTLSSVYQPNNSAAALTKGIAMAQAKNRGRFVWQELMTDDTAAASAFYTKLLGWHTKGSGGDPAYTEVLAGSTPVGGLWKTPEGAKSMWMPYIGVDQVDESVKEIEGLGGKVIRPANDIPNVGRFAVVSDPQGAVFAVFTANPPGMGPPPFPPKPGEFSWNELATTDHEAAFSFYSKAFGWEALFRHDMGPMGTYLIFGTDGVQYGGMFKMGPQHGPAPFWLPYAAVASVDASAKVVTAAGGRIVNGPMDVPGEGRIAQLTDPGGVLFAIHSVKAPAQVAAKPAVSAPAAALSKPAVPPPSPAPKPVAPPPAPKAAPPSPPKPAVPPAVKPAPVTTPPTLKPVVTADPPKAAPKPAPVAPKPTAAAPAAAKKAPARKKAAAKKKAPVKKKAPAKKKAAPKAKKKVVVRRKSAKKAAPIASKSGPKKSRKDKKKEKKKDKKNRKKDKKGRRKK